VRYQRIFKTTSGNVIGIVEERRPLDVNVPLEKQRTVRIGVIDPNRGLPKSDANRVIKRLLNFVSHLKEHERDERCFKFSSQVKSRAFSA
jgi:hypothetical protein